MPNRQFDYWFTDDGLTLIQGWARRGLNNEQIARNIGINVATLYEWKKEKPEISEALRKGKEVVDLEVENALIKRALGYEYEEVQEYSDGSTVTKHKHMPPETKAIKWWLSNRAPEQWRDEQHINHSGDVQQTIDLSDVSSEDLKVLADQYRFEEK